MEKIHKMITYIGIAFIFFVLTLLLLWTFEDPRKWAYCKEFNKEAGESASLNCIPLL